jgi:hypothetical protein
MGYEIQFDSRRKLIRVTALGSEDLGAVLEAMKELRHDPKYQKDYGILCDFRKQTFEAGPADLFRISLVLKTFFAGHKLAFVRPDSRGAGAQGDVIGMAESKVDARIFTEVPPAEEWLAGK